MNSFKYVIEWNRNDNNVNYVEEFEEISDNSDSEKELESNCERDYYSDDLLDGSPSTYDEKITHPSPVNNCQFPKFHYMKHIILQIAKCGSALNFYGEFCESNHKYLTKDTRTRIQRRSDTFNQQTVFHLGSKIVLDWALRYLELNTSRDNRNLIAKVIITNEIKPLKNFSKFIFENSNGNLCLKWKKEYKKPKHKFPIICLKILNKSILVEGYDVRNVSGFTCLKWNTEIIRAHSSYRSKNPWYDHVNVRWQGNYGDYICPSKFICSYI